MSAVLSSLKNRTGLFISPLTKLLNLSITQVRQRSQETVFEEAIPTLLLKYVDKMIDVVKYNACVPINCRKFPL